MPAPDNHIADQGLHEFTYSLYPHAADWKAGNTMRQGYELNYPLIPAVAHAHAGPWPATQSFGRVDPGNVILTVEKKAEDDDGIIFRFYEFEGKAADAHLQLPRSATSAVETDLMEKGGTPLTLASSGREVVIHAGPYEIKTVKVKFDRR
jgi:alpha-mannosidase